MEENTTTALIHKNMEIIREKEKQLNEDFKRMFPLYSCGN